MYKRIIKRGETVGLKLTSAQRKLLLTGLVFLHDSVKEAIKSTPPNRPVKLPLSELEDMAGHIAGEANHARDGHVESLLSDIFEKIEELLLLYEEEKSPVGTSLPTPAETSQMVTIRLTVFQRLAVLTQGNLTPGLKGRIERSSLRLPVEFSRDEMDDFYQRISQAVPSTPSPVRARLKSVLKRIDEAFAGEDDATQ